MQLWAARLSKHLPELMVREQGPGIPTALVPCRRGGSAAVSTAGVAGENPSECCGIREGFLEEAALEPRLHVTRGLP